MGIYKSKKKRKGLKKNKRLTKDKEYTNKGLQTSKTPVPDAVEMATAPSANALEGDAGKDWPELVQVEVVGDPSKSSSLASFSVEMDVAIGSNTSADSEEGKAASDETIISSKGPNPDRTGFSDNSGERAQSYLILLIITAGVLTRLLALVPVAVP